MVLVPPPRSVARRALLFLLLLALALALPAWGAGTEGKVGAKPTATGKLYDYYLSGSAADMQPAAPATAQLVLMGGGLDVDEAFRAMIAKAAGGSGGRVDIVVVRASGADGYNDYLLNQLYPAGTTNPVDSVETLVIKSREGADDPALNAIVARADLLFIAGGDQGDYIRQWKGSRLDTTLSGLLARKVPFGGTSAGLAVLGDIDFSAENGTITSEQALANPYDRRETLDRGFLTGLRGLLNTITDAHLVTRDRMGRLFSFLARIVQDSAGALAPTQARGIGLDENTALVVDDGLARVMGGGTAYFVQPQLAPDPIQAKKPLSMRNVRIDRLRAGGASFDLLNWTRSDGAAPYFVDALGGVLTSNPY
ncbi:cyanophycinase [Roseateles sp. DAIF2]|uniref:cyanophycinase n=1 Tax=Roseateles sp. DAIF2 TaxID=2714952 RepID=UPI0018A2ED73|nr:cyanophycinase [Roseateles sp. DAIF2]QPF76327.1 cyanophycinase [Roseateles sp. DAIF2]